MVVVVVARRGCASPRARSPPSALPLLLETGDVYGEFALLGETLFLHVAMVTDTIIKLSPSLVEETDLSEAIILRGALLLPRRAARPAPPAPAGPRSPPRALRGRILPTGLRVHPWAQAPPGSSRPPAPCQELPAPARPLGAGSTPGHIHGQEQPGQGGRCH